MSGEGKSEGASEHDKLARALSTIIEAMSGRELTAMKSSVSELDSTLAKQIAAMKKETTEVIERLMRELSSRIDGLLDKVAGAEDRQKTALAEIEERNRRSNEALEQRLLEAQSMTGERMEKLQSHLEKEIAGREQILHKELGELATGLSAVQLEVHQQMEASARTSTLLDSMASVLTGAKRVAPSPRSIPVSKAAPPRPAAKDPDSGHDENLDSALDRVFSSGNS